MESELFITTRTTDEAVIALLRDGKLIELHHEKEDDRFSVGDIYLGEVKRLAANLNAAFVEVGYEKDAFLHYHDLGPQFRSLTKFTSRVQKGKQRWSLADFESEEDINKDGKIGDVLRPGQKILVQIAKEPISTKGPRITSELSIAGRFLVLVPFSDRISISQKIEDRQERDRLRNIVKKLQAPGFGVIIRTVASGHTVEEIEADLNNLMQRWKVVHRNIPKAKPGGRVFREMGRVSSLLRDMLNDSFQNIQVDDEAVFEELSGYLSQIAPEKAHILKQYNGRIPLFEHFGIVRQIKTSFGRNVPIAKGAYLIVEHTEAMHVIDVNSGNRKGKDENQEENALAVNMMAAEEVARQMRLRDLGGIIVVDFIDMHKQENRKALFDKLRELMATDRAKHKILPPSRFGLIEITRQRVRPELNVDLMEEDPDGQGMVEAPITVINRIEGEIQQHSQNGNRKMELHVHPFVSAFLTKGLFKSLKWKWYFKYKVKLEVVPRDSFKVLEFVFEDKAKSTAKA
jgi:ribonuclease G